MILKKSLQFAGFFSSNRYKTKSLSYRMKIDKTYIIHFDKLKDRKAYLDKQIAGKLGFENTEFIIGTEEKDQKILENNRYVFDSQFSPQLTRPYIVNCEVQLSLWERIAKGEHENCLIVEDDIVFKEGYNEIFEFLMKNVPEDYDICFLSECCDLRLPNPEMNPFVESQKSRCCVAYLISREACRKIVTIQKFNASVDWHLNFIKNVLNLKYYWSDPTLFFQGSENEYESNAQKKIV